MKESNGKSEEPPSKNGDDHRRRLVEAELRERRKRSLLEKVMGRTLALRLKESA